MKEVAVTDYLTQYQDSGLAANFGKNFGPMRNYSSCNLVNDPCMIHPQPDCESNSFCVWDPLSSSCAKAPVIPKGKAKKCPSGVLPKKLVGAYNRTDRLWLLASGS